MRKVLIFCAAVLLMALLAGCAQVPSSSVTYGPGANPAHISTATPLPTPVATNGAVLADHPCSADTSGQVSYVRIGDLKVSRVDFMLAYPARQLPTNLDASKPYQLPADAYDAPHPPVNPHMSGGSGYGFTICNMSRTASHVISGVTVGISAFTPYAGTLNAWQFCDTVFARPDGPGTGGCGGAYQYDQALQATFAPDATTGARVTAAQLTTGFPYDGPDVPPLPISLGPGQMLAISLGVTPPAAPGTYTFAFGLRYDTVTDAPISTMEPTLFDSAAIQWNGQNCTRSALQSQIPMSATTPPTNYVCAP